MRLSSKIIGTADSFITFADESETLRDSLVELIDEGICSAAQGGNGKSDDVTNEFDAAAATLVDILTQLQSFADNDVTQIRDSFGQDLNSIVESVENKTTIVETHANPAYYAGPALGFGFLFMIGLLLAWSSVKRRPFFFCLQTWVLLPLFFVFIFISIIIIAAVGMVLVANAGAYVSFFQSLLLKFYFFPLDNNPSYDNDMFLINC
jgi:hypothetical protein